MDSHVFDHTNLSTEEGLKLIKKPKFQRPVGEDEDLFVELAAISPTDATPKDWQKSIPPCTGNDVARWEHIVGNTAVKRALKAFVLNKKPNVHVLIHGPNRSGKTMLVDFALQSKFCLQRSADLNPCHECSNCLTWRAGPDYRNELFKDINGQLWKFLSVDGTNTDTFDDRLICFYNKPQAPLICHVDEVSAPEFVGRLMSKLLNPMMQRPICIIATGVRIIGRKDRATNQRLPGLSRDFRFRFNTIERTTAPHQDELKAWVARRASEMGLATTPEAINLIVEQAHNIPGQALRPLKKAALLGAELTREFVQTFRWNE